MLRQAVEVKSYFQQHRTGRTAAGARTARYSQDGSSMATQGMVMLAML